METVICGEDDELPAGPELSSLIGTGGQQDCVYYGWPLVLVKDARGAARVAPLLMTVLSVEKDGTFVPADDEPYLNGGLLNTDFVPPETLAFVGEAVGPGIPFGDSQAMAARVKELLTILDVDIVGDAVDPSSLDPRARLVRPGAYNTAGAFRGPSQVMTRALLDELEEMQSKDPGGTAASILLQATSSSPPVDGDVLAAAALNDSQEEALRSAGRAPLTVVTGPPGTGKSQLVAAIAASAWVAGQSVLVASTNNGAVDVAVKRAADIDPGLLVRTGNRTHRDALPELLESLAARDPDQTVSPDVARRQLEVAVAGRRALIERLERRSEVEHRLAQLVLDLEARCALLWGTATSPVEDESAVLARRARRLERAWLFAGRRRQRLLEQARVRSPNLTVTDVAEWAEAEQERTSLSAPAEGTWPDASEEWEALQKADEAWLQASLVEVRATVQTRLHQGAAVLRKLARLRLNNRDARARAVGEAIPTVYGWGCTALSLRDNFPLSAGLFDVVVLDEASQCAIAEILPLAYRAKRLVVVGDPNQLSPIVKLDAAQLKAIAASCGTTHEALVAASLSCGADSAFTAFAARASRTHLLDEHYRCHPAIARFFNHTFYDGRLRVLTDVSRFADSATTGLQWLSVRGRTQRGEYGSATNATEAAVVVDTIVGHVLQGDSLGVVTPFAAQAALIDRLLKKHVSADARKAVDLTCGTAHRFQGDERDVMVFSPVLSEGANPATARWVETQRHLVNVAVSRARKALIVVGDDDAPSALGVPTLEALREACAAEAAEAVEVRPEHLHSESERRLYDALVAAGLPVTVKPLVEGYELDFGLRKAAGGGLDIECDGSQHIDVRGRQRRQDLARDAVLASVGWSVVRYPAWRCLREPTAVAEEVRMRWAEQSGH